MADHSLRLPSSTFRAVLNLGPMRAAKLPLPLGFVKPVLDAEWDEDTLTSGVYVHFEDGELHLECTDKGVDYHYHTDDGESSDTSPWSKKETATLLEWAVLLAMDVFERMPELDDDIEEAAAWQEDGLPIYVCETEPVSLELLEVEIEGEMLTLPWLGSGTVANEHTDGDNHPIVLLWNPAGAEPDRPIARAWLDPATDEPTAEAIPGVDWNAVGMSADDVVEWVEGIYLNHHVLADPASEIMRAALERMGGVEGLPE
ncbi:MAG: hypothetical protein H7146_04310 [Burkholderiaceae bacterium]|nr:hypothetical protein [Microbacteriaceae bacterium]